eukprot:15469824-Alexandrium_andersonii.AAC.1
MVPFIIPIGLPVGVLAAHSPNLFADRSPRYDVWKGIVDPPPPPGARACLRDWYSCSRRADQS